MHDEKEIRALVDMFVSIINKYTRLAHTPKLYGTGELLYAAELNAIETI